MARRSAPNQLALNLGASRGRVSQVLRLLSLCPQVLEVITGLGDPLPARIITERQLRLLVYLSVGQQENADSR